MRELKDIANSCTEQEFRYFVLQQLQRINDSLDKLKRAKHPSVEEVNKALLEGNAVLNQSGLLSVEQHSIVERQPVYPSIIDPIDSVNRVKEEISQFAKIYCRTPCEIKCNDVFNKIYEFLAQSTQRNLTMEHCFANFFIPNCTILMSKISIILSASNRYGKTTTGVIQKLNERYGIRVVEHRAHLFIEWILYIMKDNGIIRLDGAQWMFVRQDRMFVRQDSTQWRFVGQTSLGTAMRFTDRFWNI